ncbi:hypothetical protein QA641_12015 [Bradyrhizobium sp. CB1650]|uniref:hypothetical protein n=1 Tax=Bradyrhizobium sp. CB1650 TaxID=3039153 RepID=UPI0024356DC6|nr:hypothetical protein [Bradyrhizobium sp. CB1650]WGD54568.1 hypothetical protein QA641_12015 [Bradyrhizobium sp. CB1650]
MDDTPARKVNQGWASRRRKDSGGGMSDDGSNRDKVLEAKRRASYKSVIAGIFASDFSLKITPCAGRLKYRNTICFSIA